MAVTTNYNYLSPTNKIRWRKAIMARAKKVELTDGRVFKIRYSKIHMKVSDETLDVAIFRGPRIQDPSGYMRISKVSDESWVYTDETSSGTDSFYVSKLEEFLKSKEQGVDAKAEWPELAGRLKETIRRGFIGAKVAIGKRASKVVITTQGERIFLLKDE